MSRCGPEMTNQLMFFHITVQWHGGWIQAAFVESFLAKFLTFIKILSLYIVEKFLIQTVTQLTIYALVSIASGNDDYEFHASKYSMHIRQNRTHATLVRRPNYNRFAVFPSSHQQLVDAVISFTFTKTHPFCLREDQMFLLKLNRNVQCAIV